MARLLSPWSGRQITDANGTPVSGARAYHYAAGTTSNLTVYTAATGSSTHPQPVAADAGGYLPLIYIPEQSWKVEFRQPPPDEFTLGALVLGPYDNLQGGTPATETSVYSKPQMVWSVISAGFTLAPDDTGRSFAVTPSSGTLTIILPSAIDAGNGRGFLFKKFGAGGTLRVSAISGQTVEGASRIEVSADREVVEISSDGANWQVVSSLGWKAGDTKWTRRPVAEAGWLPMNGAAVLRTDYPLLDAAIYVGNSLNASAPDGFRCTNPANPTGTRNVNGAYIALPGVDGYFPRAVDTIGSVDTGRAFASYQDDLLRDHFHNNNPPFRNDLTGQGSGNNVAWRGDTAPSVPTGGVGGGLGGVETRPYNYAINWFIKH